MCLHSTSKELRKDKVKLSQSLCNNKGSKLCLRSKFREWCWDHLPNKRTFMLLWVTNMTQETQIKEAISLPNKWNQSIQALKTVVVDTRSILRSPTNMAFKDYKPLKLWSLKSILALEDEFQAIKVWVPNSSKLRNHQRKTIWTSLRRPMHTPWVH